MYFGCTVIQFQRLYIFPQWLHFLSEIVSLPLNLFQLLLKQPTKNSHEFQKLIDPGSFHFSFLLLLFLLFNSTDVLRYCAKKKHTKIKKNSINNTFDKSKSEAIRIDEVEIWRRKAKDSSVNENPVAIPWRTTFCWSSNAGVSWESCLLFLVKYLYAQ